MNLSWVIRSVRLVDAPDLQRNCFPEQSLIEVEHYLAWCLAQADKGSTVRLVSEVGGEVVANGQLSIRHRVGEIGSLIVAPAHRRRGLGSALLDALLAKAAQRGLTAVEIMADTGEPWVRAWYERRGFLFVEERTLPRGERLAYMWLKLSERVVRM